MIDPGQMRTRVVYQTPTRVDDGGGASHDSWSDAFTLWARVRPSKADEATVQGPRVRATVDYDLVCRFDPRIDAAGRFRIDGTDRTLSISSAVDWEFRSAELSCRCHENVSGATS